jgi:DNA-binding MarR family transcriptional regulator
MTDANLKAPGDGAAPARVQGRGPSHADGRRSGRNRTRDIGVAAHSADRPPAANPDPMVALVEAFFFAYREFTGDADMVLAELEFGRAHHRVLHFVHHYPGLRVIDLLDVLKITKQSLARVLKALIDGGFVVQRAGPNDRRERRLFATADGQALANRLIALQIARLNGALQVAGPQTDMPLRAVLDAMVGEDERRRIQDICGATRRLQADSESR